DFREVDAERNAEALRVLRRPHQPFLRSFPAFPIGELVLEVVGDIRLALRRAQDTAVAYRRRGHLAAVELDVRGVALGIGRFGVEDEAPDHEPGAYGIACDAVWRPWRLCRRGV